MKMVWYVALGGAVGSVARYLVGLTVQSRSGLDFPVGTLLVNLSGCLLLGFLARIPAPDIRGQPGDPGTAHHRALRGVHDVLHFLL